MIGVVNIVYSWFLLSCKIFGSEKKSLGYFTTVVFLAVFLLSFNCEAKNFLAMCPCYPPTVNFVQLLGLNKLFVQPAFMKMCWLKTWYTNIAFKWKYYILHIKICLKCIKKHCICEYYPSGAKARKNTDNTHQLISSHTGV